MCAQPLDKNCLQLAGLTAFFIASKLEEIDPPEIPELVSLCAATYKPVNFKHMEVIMLSKLRFELATPTSGFLLQHLAVVEDEIEWPHDLAR